MNIIVNQIQFLPIFSKNFERSLKKIYEQFLLLLKITHGSIQD